ncbi:MAG: hypothetical protein ACYCXG_07400 [Acidiferrobacter sp.]
MRVDRTDPETGYTAEHLEGHPFIIEGTGEEAIKVYFESEENRQRYLAIPTEHPEQDWSKTLDNPAPLPGDEPNGLPQQQG